MVLGVLAGIPLARTVAAALALRGPLTGRMRRG